MGTLGTRGLIVGSTAMQHWFNDDVREPKDLDVFAPCQYSIAETFWHPDFEDWITLDADRFATVDELYTLKVSHAYWELKNGSWNKHMADVVFLRDQGATLLLDLHTLLYQVWEDTHGKKKTNLSMESGQFFKDAVVRKYDHDSVHAAVAYGDEPMYLQVLKDGRSVSMDMDKVRAMSFEDQVRLFREEVYATAMERVMIPNRLRFSPRHAYAWALRRTITSLTRGWSARFIVENYKTFRVPDMDYVARYLSNVHKLIPLEDVQ